MNNLDAAFSEMWTVAFLWAFCSFVMEKMGNKGDSVRWEEEGGATVFSVMRSLEIALCCSFWSRPFLVILGFFSLLKSSFVTFREEVLKTLLLMSNFLWLVQNHLYHSRTINWIGSYWRGTWRRSPVEGVNSVINSVCDSVSVFSTWHLFISLVSHSCSEHFISINDVPLSNLLHAFFYTKILMH